MEAPSAARVDRLGPRAYRAHAVYTESLEVDILLRQQSASGVLTLTLHRPERRNALDLALADELVRALEAAEESPAVRVVVLTGAGDAFCSGGDLAGYGFEGHSLALLRRISRPALALHRLAKPAIARVNGVAAGAGWSLALGCDLVVASEQARFSQIFVRRALSLDLGSSWLLPRLVGLHRAKELALLGSWVSAGEALALGLANRVVPAGELDAAVAEWAERLAAGPPVALALTKRMLAESAERSFEAAIEAECGAQSVNLATQDTREAFRAFFAKREPRFDGR
jgi:2-(1,2-epoxy-1,2-dihydrophenyl)acetyl-CoA isomerase